MSIEVICILLEIGNAAAVDPLFFSPGRRHRRPLIYFFPVAVDPLFFSRLETKRKFSIEIRLISMKFRSKPGPSTPYFFPGHRRPLIYFFPVAVDPLFFSILETKRKFSIEIRLISIKFRSKPGPSTPYLFFPGRRRPLIFFGRRRPLIFSILETKRNFRSKPVPIKRLNQTLFSHLSSSFQLPFFQTPIID
jgi:hypothetical protein